MKTVNQTDKISVYFQVRQEREIDTTEREKTELQDILNYQRTSVALFILLFTIRIHLDIT